jgi:hypothetical protein
MASSTSASMIPLRDMQTTQSNSSDRENQDQGVPAVEISSASNMATELRPMTKQRQILVLISSFLTICITIGFNQSYGVFQSYYISPTQTMLPKSTSKDSALVAFVGTLGTGLTWGGSIIVNPIIARLGIKGIRGISVLGVLFMSLGFGLASLGTQVAYHPPFHCPTTLSTFSGLASSPNPRVALWNWLLMPLLPYPQRSPGILYCP